MTRWRTSVLSKLLRCGASLLALGLVAITWTVSGEQVKQPSSATLVESGVPRHPIPQRDSASWRCSPGRIFPDERANS